MADMAHLIEPVIPALRRYARTLVRGAADADDLVQDPLERAILAGISGDPTAKRVHGFSPSCTTWRSITYGGRRGVVGRFPSTMPARQMLPCRRHRRTRCGVTISWGPLDSYPTTSAASYFSFPSKT